MFERRKEEKDVLGGWAGDPLTDPEGKFANFPDWDNPEDAEEAPDGYYEAADDEDEDDDSYVPDEDDPDYDLTEAAGYAGWDAPKHSGPMPEWVITTIAVVLVLAIVLGIIATIR
jgi:hypothetical protein